MFVTEVCILFLFLVSDIYKVGHTNIRHCLTFFQIGAAYDEITSAKFQQT